MRCQNDYSKSLSSAGEDPQGLHARPSFHDAKSDSASPQIDLLACCRRAQWSHIWSPESHLDMAAFRMSQAQQT